MIIFFYNQSLYLREGQQRHACGRESPQAMNGAEDLVADSPTLLCAA